LHLCLLLGARAEAPSDRPLADWLSDAGLFVAGSTTVVRPELVPFAPQYPLWSDGATKRRWIELPAGTFIDATNPDAWEFPRGTRLWKEFSLDRRIETRLIERTEGSWRYATYVWNATGTDAELAPREGIAALPITEGRRWAIPSEYDCRACHEGAPVPVLGFSALQLSGDRDPNAAHADGSNRAELDLQALNAAGLLRNLPDVLLESPPRIAARSATERAALGYLHGNCAHCHSDASATDAAVPVGVRLAQTVAETDSSAHVLQSIVGAASRFRPHGAAAPTTVVAPGRADQSVLPLRMRSRDPRVQMPPLGTQIPDSTGLALIERWINHDLKKLEKKESSP
jgi:hypothetical protein